MLRRGPRLENGAITSLTSTAPTVRAASADPGELTVDGPLPPLLPAAMTNSVSDAGGQLVDRLRQRVGAVVGVAAEAHADDVGALVDGPLHAREDPGVLAVAGVGEHLADDQVRAGRDALAQPAGRGAVAGDGRRDVRAVAVAVDVGVVGREVRRADHEAGREVGVRRVDAGVEDRDGAPVPS